MKKIIIAVVLAVVLIAGGLGGFVYAQEEPVNKVWVHFLTVQDYVPSGDTFTNREVTGGQSWEVYLSNEADESGQLVKALNLSLDSELFFNHLGEENLTRMGPLTYEWSFGDVSEDSDATTWVGHPDEFPVTFTPGFDASRSADEIEFTGPDIQTQTLTITVTPRRENEEITIGVNTEGNWLVSPVIVSPSTYEQHGIWLSPDGYQLRISPLEGWQVGIPRSFIVTLEVTPNVAKVEYIPYVYIQWSETLAAGTDIGRSGSYTMPEVGIWTWSATGDYTWHWNHPLLRTVVFLHRVEEIVNIPPVADAGGPYIGNEGSAITFGASASSDPDGDVLQYRWDFDNDGTWDTAWSSDPTVSYTWDDDYTGTVILEVSDGTLTDADTATVTVNNLPPTVGDIAVLPAALVEVNTEINASATFTDPGTEDTHTAVWDWGDGSPDTVYGAISPVAASHTYTVAGVYTVKLTVTDDDTDSGQSVFEYVVVYDPDAGFVTGGGWINSPEGAYVAAPSLTGKANFGFVSRYKKGATEPTGQTQFRFQVANLNFHSTSYQWLVVAGARAQYKGTGTINGVGEYKFLLTGIDADLNDSDAFDIDRFRIKIWAETNGTEDVIYDNALGDDGDNATTEIGGGSVVIHKSKK